MSIFSAIKDAIFRHPAATQAQPGSASTPAATTTSSSASGGSSPSATSSSSAPAQNVDVAAVLDQAVAKKGEKLQWRTSIVDLMKALDLDSSLSARKELAHDLQYTGDTGDSAAMNMWLHKQVMKKLAENGGKVPDSLRT